MYTPGQGGGSPLTGIASTVTGVAVLPNTGGNMLLAVIAAVNLVVGVVIISTTVARFVAKKAHNA